jgi:ferredoxin
MKVWIDQDLCTGDGICEQICPSVFIGQPDGLFYVKDLDGNIKLNGEMVDIPEGLLDAVEESATECPGECIFIEKE